MTLSIAGQTFTTYQGNAHSAVLRIYSNQNFEDTDSIMHSAGSVGSNSYFFSSGCTITNGVVNVPQVGHPLPITTDIETTIFTAGVYTRNGQLILTVLPNYRLDANLAPSTTWETIKLFSTENNIRISGDVYTKQQVDELLSNISVNIVTLANTYSNSLATAITAIGSTPTTLVVDENTTVSTSLTVPSTLILDMRAEALISKSGSGAIHFAGVGLVDPESTVPVFSGFSAGDITWTGTTSDAKPAAISTELWSTGNTSLSDRLTRANAAFGDSFIKIVCYPRTITTYVNFNPYKEIYFTPGDYPSVLTGGYGAFQVSSYTHIHGTLDARIGESVLLYGTRIIEPYGSDTHGSYTNIIVENLTFWGNDLAANDGTSSTVILGNAKNSSIRNNIFYRTHAYGAYLGGFGDNGNYAENSEIVGNTFVGIGTQVCGTINGRNIRIADNIFDQRKSTSFATYTVIDVEPNIGDDIVENLVIENNLIDARDYTSLPQNFAPADVNLTTNTITLPSHGLVTGRQVQFSTTGTLPAPLVVATNYYARYVDDNTISVAATDGGPIIDLTTQGTGTHTITEQPKYLYGILVQGRMQGGVKNAVIHNNTIIGGDIVPYNFGALIIGIGASGELLEVSNNVVLGGIQGSISVGAGRHARITNNHMIQTEDTNGFNDQLLISGTADSFITDNVVQKSQNGILAGIFENEIAYACTSSGSTLTNTQSPFISLFYDYYVGLTMTFNGNDYVVSTFVGFVTLTMTTSIGTVTTQTWVPANVNTGAESITITSHGYNTGATVLLSTTGALPAHTLPPVSSYGVYVYYLIKVDANTIKLASSLANALSNTPINLTDVGSGTGTVSPIAITKFSNNIYDKNYASDGIHLEPTGSSQIISTKHDQFITTVVDADHTATTAEGTIIYTSLSAGRTVNLPDATTCKGKMFIVKDGAGNAATFNITLDGNGSQTIDGAATKVISTNYGSLRIQSNGSNWLTL